MGELYTIEELKQLKLGDKVITWFKNYDKRKPRIESTTVALNNKAAIIFDNGYDFPYNHPGSVQTTDAYQDDGDYEFKVFKTI